MGNFFSSLKYHYHLKHVLECLPEIYVYYKCSNDLCTCKDTINRTRRYKIEYCEQNCDCDVVHCANR